MSGLPSPPSISSSTPSSKSQLLYAPSASFPVNRHEPQKLYEPDLEARRSIIISAPVRIGDDVGAQVVLKKDNLVAKIFDPFFYREAEVDSTTEGASGYFQNAADESCIARAASHYTKETDAYSADSTQRFQGNIMPKFYGSWTLNIPDACSPEHHREVQMVLLEYIEGTSMKDIELDKIASEGRKNVLEKVIEADMMLGFAKLSHGDLEPRNIILPSPLCDSSFNDPHFRVCIFDFALSELFDKLEKTLKLWYYREEFEPWTKKPLKEWVRVTYGNSKEYVQELGRLYERLPKLTTIVNKGRKRGRFVEIRGSLGAPGRWTVTKDRGYVRARLQPSLRESLYGLHSVDNTPRVIINQSRATYVTADFMQRVQGRTQRWL